MAICVFTCWLWLDLLGPKVHSQMQSTDQGFPVYSVRLWPVDLIEGQLFTVIAQFKWWLVTCSASTLILLQVIHSMEPESRYCSFNKPVVPNKHLKISSATFWKCRSTRKNWSPMTGKHNIKGRKCMTIHLKPKVIITMTPDNERDDVSNHQPHDCYSSGYSGANQRKHQSSASLAFVRGIHQWPVNSPHKGPITRNGEFPAQRANNAENASIWWRHHVMMPTLSLVFIIITCIAVRDDRVGIMTTLSFHFQQNVLTKALI